MESGTPNFFKKNFTILLRSFQRLEKPVKVIKATIVVGGIIGAISDVLTPIVHLASYIASLSLLAFAFLFLWRIRPLLTEKGLDYVLSQWVGKFALISILLTVVMGFFWILATLSPKIGFLASKSEAVRSIQDQLLPEIRTISYAQSEIRTDVKEIKQLLTEQQSLRENTNVEDASAIEQLNDRTTKTKRKTIAVLYFDNTSNNASLAPLRKGLADMFISDLSHISMLKVVEREKLQKLVGELN